MNAAKRLELWVAVCTAAALAQDQHWEAGMQTVGTATFGKWETRMIIPGGTGLIGAYYLFDSEARDSGSWHEIDMELYGMAPNVLETKCHMHENPPKSALVYHPERIGKWTAPVDPGKGYHTYSIEWSPDYIRFGFDGTQYRRIERGQSDKLDDLLDGLQDAKMSPTLSFRGFYTSWSGWLNVQSLPKHLFVNWVRYHRYSPGEGPGDFTLAWQENFDTLPTDTSQWYIWDWGVASPLNATALGGVLVLTANRKDTPFGYNEDTIPMDDEGTYVPTERYTVETPLALQAPRMRASERLSMGDGTVCCTHPIGPLRIGLYTLDGQIVGSVVDGKRGTGANRLPLSLSGHPAGIYVLRIETGPRAAAPRIVLQQ